MYKAADTASSVFYSLFMVYLSRLYKAEQGVADRGTDNIPGLYGIGFSDTGIKTTDNRTIYEKISDRNSGSCGCRKDNFIGRNSLPERHASENRQGR